MLIDCSALGISFSSTVCSLPLGLNLSASDTLARFSIKLTWLALFALAIFSVATPIAT